MAPLAHFLCLLLPASLVSAAAIRKDAPTFFRRSGAVYPSEDPFYTAPAGFASKAPGNILRSRVTPAGLANMSNAKTSYQLLYRTQNTMGQPEAAVTTVIVPKSPNPQALLSYQVPYDSADEDCGPSYSLQNGATLNTTDVEGDAAFINDMLGDGYFVNTPDYEGPSGAFTSGLQSGYATLDSVRAALKSQAITGVSPSAKYAMWGYSGGALASEWAAELQPSYAPELNFIGIALGGLTPNILNVLFTINGGALVGLAPAGIIGIARAYPDVNTYLNSKLIPATAATFLSAGKQCLTSDITTFAFQNMSMYFNGGINDLYTPIPQKALTATGIMGTHGTPKAPLYVYKAVNDEVSPVADTDALVKKLCSQGSIIQYIRDTVGGHLVVEQSGAPGAMAFLVNRFNGVPVVPFCTTTTTT